MEYYAHSREIEGKTEYQTIKEHAEGVAKLIKEFSKQWCSAEFAEDLGLLHDIGKYRTDFQRRIRGENVQTEHSIWGAVECEEYSLPDAAAYCIAGHHAGLPDIGSVTQAEGTSTLSSRLKYAKRHNSVKEYEKYKDELNLTAVNHDFQTFRGTVRGEGEQAWKEYAFWIRMMFSCLVDADFIDTESYCDGKTERGISADFNRCKEILEKRLSELEQKADTPAKKARKTLREQIMKHIKDEAELYYMNLPTGGGKTLASLQFALYRAIESGKKRIIYIIPYTSIIEQTASTFKELFGEEAVLEHHSDFDFENYPDKRLSEKMRRSAENWDASVIVTTNVRFFESIYGNRTSVVRKLHNIADSILIFDEVHMLPSGYFQPCMEAVKILTARYGCEAIFLTATMPHFDKWLEEFKCGDMRTVELVTDKTCFSSFERCSVENMGLISVETLLTQAGRAENALVVVNKRKTARTLYKAYQGKKYHLSTYMNHFDRKRVIEDVRRALQNGEKFCLFSTSLIEAGVDLDFNTVFREQAGLDNLLQTAGRCNRNGEFKNSVAYSFRLDNSDGGVNCSTEMAKKSYFTSEIFESFNKANSVEAIETYFDKLFLYELSNMKSNDFLLAKDKEGCVGSFENRVKLINSSTVGKGVKPVPYNFAGYAETFRLIDENTYPLVIVTKENNDEIEEIFRSLEFGAGRSALRKLQKYTVSLRQYERKKLYEAGVLGERAGIEYLSNKNYYKNDIGLIFEDDNIYLF